MDKRKIILVMCSILLFAYCLDAQGVQILERKVISKQATDCDMHLTKLIFNDDDNVLITMQNLLYTNNNLLKMNDVYGRFNDYCCFFCGGFVKDNKFYIVFDDVNTINIYSINTPEKKLDIVSSIKPISVFCPDYTALIFSPEYNGSYYLLGHSLFPPANPIGFVKSMMDALSQKARVFYYKPRLAEIRNDKMVRCIDFDYGCKTDESYVVNEVTTGKGSIHFFGFRNIDVPFIEEQQEPIKLASPYSAGYEEKWYNYDTGGYCEHRDISQPIILYYADYNLEKKKNIRKYTIYQNAPGYDKKTDTYCDYGVLSADSQDDNVFVVFSWVKWQRHHAGSTMVEGQGLKHKEGFNLNDVNSDIYYWQCSDKSYGKAEKIAEGFCPIVKVDQFGIVHVFWIDRGKNVVHKIKENGKWSDEKVILSGISENPTIIYTKRCSAPIDYDRPEAILYTKFFAAEFDKDNNLHAVYPTSEGVVYTKMKLEE